METLPFPQLTGLAEDEVLIFSFIVYSSRQHRDEVNAKVMTDPSMSPEKMKDKPMPFDMKRLGMEGSQFWSTFRPAVEPPMWSNQ